MRDETECALGTFLPEFYDSPHRAAQHTFSARVVVWCVVVIALCAALAVSKADRSKVERTQQAQK